MDSKDCARRQLIDSESHATRQLIYSRNCVRKMLRDSNDRACRKLAQCQVKLK